MWTIYVYQIIYSFLILLTEFNFYSVFYRFHNFFFLVLSGNLCAIPQQVFNNKLPNTKNVFISRAIVWLSSSRVPPIPPQEVHGLFICHDVVNLNFISFLKSLIVFYAKNYMIIKIMIVILKKDSYFLLIFVYLYVFFFTIKQSS